MGRTGAVWLENGSEFLVTVAMEDEQDRIWGFEDVNLSVKRFLEVASEMADTVHVSPFLAWLAPVRALYSSPSLGSLAVVLARNFRGHCGEVRRPA